MYLSCRSLLAIILLSIVFFSVNTLANNKPSFQPDVILFVNADEGFPFWQSEVNFVQAVAKALNIKMTAHYIPAKYRDRFGIVDYIEQYLEQRKHVPDLVMSAFYLEAEEKLLTLLDKKSIPFISLNSYISAEQYEKLGQPREHFKLWLGHFSPNDVQVGRQLIQSLLDLYRKNNACDKSVCGANVFGFTGLAYAAVSQQRVAGVEQAVREDRKSSNFNNVAANWRRAITFEKMSIVVNRHPDIDIFWAASDNMAWGIVDGIKAYQYKNKVLVGSIDWSPDTIPYIKNDDIQISIGGHFLEGGLALILYYDYLHGKDFADTLGTVIEIKMSELNKQNVDRIGPFLNSPKWNQNVLYNYSKFNNPKREKYLFDPLEIINQQLN